MTITIMCMKKYIQRDRLYANLLPEKSKMELNMKNDKQVSCCNFSNKPKHNCTSRSTQLFINRFSIIFYYEFEKKIKTIYKNI